MIFVGSYLFELAKEIRKIDGNVKMCFIIAGEIPNKVRFDAQEEGNRDRFIKLPIENKDLIEQIGRMVHS
jgi:hypothetical protein